MTQDAWLLETYYSWLASESFSDNQERREYDGVLRLLHDVPFYWTIWSDENRAGDALSFRQFDFLGLQENLGGLDQAWLNQWAIATPSVLEVLLGMARRWSFYFEAPVPFFFQHLFRNLGLDHFPGRALSGSSQDAVRIKLDEWMSRTFEPNGKGSPFPLTHIHAHTNLGTGEVVELDMRTADIWSQMNAYSAEHFQ